MQNDDLISRAELLRKLASWSPITKNAGIWISLAIIINEMPTVSVKPGGDDEYLKKSDVLRTVLALSPSQGTNTPVYRETIKSIPVYIFPDVMAQPPQQPAPEPTKPADEDAGKRYLSRAMAAQNTQPAPEPVKPADDDKLSKDEWQRKQDVEYINKVMGSLGQYPRSTRSIARIAAKLLDYLPCGGAEAVEADQAAYKASKQPTPDLMAMVDDYTHVNRHVAGTRDVANILRAIVKEIRRG